MNSLTQDSNSDLANTTAESLVPGDVIEVRITDHTSRNHKKVPTIIHIIEVTRRVTQVRLLGYRLDPVTKDRVWYRSGWLDSKCRFHVPF